MNRRLDEERQLTRQAAFRSGHHDAGRQLAQLADQRAPLQPVRDRDLIAEAREELADCRNYLVWAIQAGQIDADTGLDSLSHVISAYAQLR